MLKLLVKTVRKGLFSKVMENFEDNKFSNENINNKITQLRLALVDLEMRMVWVGLVLN